MISDDLVARIFIPYIANIKSIVSSLPGYTISERKKRLYVTIPRVCTNAQLVDYMPDYYTQYPNHMNFLAQSGFRPKSVIIIPSFERSTLPTARLFVKGCWMKSRKIFLEVLENKRMSEIYSSLGK
ncbi:MAG: hypothetical protein ACI8Y7_000157 [Candidatus Woesearchaeota archaeon]|jgi:hypothetical protein